MSRALAEYDKWVIVEPVHIDELNHVNNVQYLAWVQDVAREHWESAASKQTRNNVYWVVIRHTITYKRACYLGEKLRLHTQVTDDISGATWGRNVWIYNEQRQLSAEAFTQWCLIDSGSGRPKRITPEIEKIFIKA